MRWMIVMLGALAGLACSGGAAPQSPTPSSPTQAPPAPAPPAQPAPSTPPAPVVAPTAPVLPSPTAELDAPSIDLLRAVPTQVTVSSAYRADPAQVGRLLDGDLETAWNSQTGDLAGAWISIALPADAQVTEIRMTAGFTHVQSGRDLFTGNHRVAEVRVSREGADLGTFPLDVSSRALQRIPVSGPGGTYRLEVTRVAAGDRSDWREACVSELQVLGRAPGAIEGAHVPSTSIGSSAPAAEPAPAAETAAAPAPAPSRDAAYFEVAGLGLVRVGSAGPEVLFPEALADFAVDEAGAVYVVTRDGSRVVSIARGERRELPAPPNEALCCVAIAPDGAPVVASAFGIWRRRGDAWGEREIMDPQRDGEGEQPQAIAVDGRGAIWARGQHSLFRTLAGRWVRDYLPGVGDLRVIALDVRDGVVAAATDRDVFVKRPSWQAHPRPFASVALREVAVGPDGAVVAGAYDAVALFPVDAEPRAATLERAGIVTGIALDARGRVWVSGTGVVAVLAPDLSVLARWSPASTPWLGGAVESMRVTGSGPELPPE